MSESGIPESPDIEGSILEEQIEICDDIIDAIMDEHANDGDSGDEDVRQVQGYYTEVRDASVLAFRQRSQTGAVYDASKLLLRTIAQERGYEHRMHYTDDKGRERVSDAIDNAYYWFKLYAGGVLNKKPDIADEWGIRLLKKHRDKKVSHPPKIDPIRNGPDPTLLSSIIPYWNALEDILLHWRKTLDLEENDPNQVEHREQVLLGEEEPEDRHISFRFGFVRDLHHDSRPHKKDRGYITDFKDGEEGEGVCFNVDEIDFFPTVGDVVMYRLPLDSDPTNLQYVNENVKLVE